MPVIPEELLLGLTGPKKKFLVLVDVLSGYTEVFRFLLPSTSAKIVSKLKDFWNMTGWPVVFCSDSEPNLVSAEFDEILANNNITRRRSSAGYPQSNGAAKMAVQSFKRLYKKKEVDKEPWQGAWALWRSTIPCPFLVWSPNTISTMVLPGYFCGGQGDRRDSPDKRFKHQEVKWSPRPGSRVLMGDHSNPRVKDSLGIVL